MTARLPGTAQHRSPRAQLCQSHPRRSTTISSMPRAGLSQPEGFCRYAKAGRVDRQMHSPHLRAAPVQIRGEPRSRRGAQTQGISDFSFRPSCDETIGRNLLLKSGGVDGPVGSRLPASGIGNATERRQDVRVFIPSIRRVAALDSVQCTAAYMIFCSVASAGVNSSTMRPRRATRIRSDRFNISGK